MTGRAWFTVLFVIILVVLAGGTFLRCESTAPTVGLVDVEGELFLGDAPLELRFVASDEDSGIRSMEALLRHADGEVPLAKEVPGGNPVIGNATFASSVEEGFTLDPEKLGLPEGGAVIELRARDYSWTNTFSGNTTVVEIPLTVDRTAPRLSVATGLSYVQRGGSGAVRYRVLEATERDGVQVGDQHFRGYPLPGGGEGDRVALYAIPRNSDPQVKIRVYAEDRAGNKREVSWPVRVKQRSFEAIEIRLGESFMEGKVPSLAGELGIDGETAVEQFQKINRDERARNEETIRGIVSKSGGERFFEGRFLQMKASAVTSRFAEHRTYLVSGNKVSEAIHYGYDLASVSAAPIEAANAGVVLSAGPLGIYGNCVIVDHGLGLTSLYAHLREIDVSEGDRVEKGQRLGRSGATGLAGGDHLHFAMLIGETYVDPNEWWDEKWIRDKVHPALPPVVAETAANDATAKP